MYYYHDSSGQYLFDRVLQGFWIAIKWAIKMAIFFPLWFTGYVIASGILDDTDSAFAWIGLILFIAVLLYQLVFFLKGILIGFISEGHLLLALPVLAICMTFTAIYPLWLGFDSIQAIAAELSAESADTLTSVMVIAAGLLIYSKYHFLTNIAPVSAYPAYQLGIDTALTLLQISPGFEGEKSQQLI